MKHWKLPQTLLTKPRQTVNSQYDENCLIRNIENSKFPSLETSKTTKRLLSKCRKLQNACFHNVENFKTSTHKMLKQLQNVFSRRAKNDRNPQLRKCRNYTNYTILNVNNYKISTLETSKKVFTFDM